MTTLSDRLLWLKSLAGRHLGHAVDIRRHLAGVNIERTSAIDCGCGLNDTVVSRQLLRLPFRTLVSVDGCPEVAALAQRRSALATQREVLCLPLSAIAAHFRRAKTFDVAFCLDVVEHLAKDDALSFLADLESIVRRCIVLWVPLGDYRVDADPHGRGNALEKHLSFWSAEEYTALGYQITVLPRFHRARYDAMWATKEIEA